MRRFLLALGLSLSAIALPLPSVVSLPDLPAIVATADAAVNDTQVDCRSVSAGATSDVQPAGTDEWSIHLLEFDGDIVLQMFKSSGSVTTEFKRYLGPDFQPVVIEITNGIFLRVKNPSGTASLTFCYHGKQTK